MSEHLSESPIARNPFMLMLNPELVVAAMEKSETLAQLNRHQCRPLDRVTLQNPTGADAEPESVEAEAEAEIEISAATNGLDNTVGGEH